VKALTNLCSNTFNQIHVLIGGKIFFEQINQVYHAMEGREAVGGRGEK
jgi:hypothetical protein